MLMFKYSLKNAISFLVLSTMCCNVFQPSFAQDTSVTRAAVKTQGSLYWELLEGLKTIAIHTSDHASGYEAMLAGKFRQLGLKVSEDVKVADAVISLILINGATGNYCRFDVLQPVTLVRNPRLRKTIPTYWLDVMPGSAPPDLQVQILIDQFCHDFERANPAITDQSKANLGSKR